MKSKIRIMDIFIVVACVAAALLFVNKLNVADGRTEAFQGEQEADITVNVPYMDNEIAEHIKVGAPFKDVTQSVKIGEITDVVAEPMRDEDFTFNGKTLSFDKDRYKKLTIHVKAKGKKTDKGILIGETNYLVGQSNDYSAGIVKLGQVRMSAIHYQGE